MLDRKGVLNTEFKYLDKGHLTKPLEKLVIRGFAEYYDASSGHNAIVFNKEGLLTGEVIREMESKNILIQINYFVYSNLMGHYGAFIVVVMTLIGILKIICK